MIRNVRLLGLVWVMSLASGLLKGLFGGLWAICILSSHLNILVCFYPIILLFCLKVWGIVIVVYFVLCFLDVVPMLYYCCHFYLREGFSYIPKHVYLRIGNGC